MIVYTGIVAQADPGEKSCPSSGLYCAFIGMNGQHCRRTCCALASLSSSLALPHLDIGGESCVGGAGAKSVPHFCGMMSGSTVLCVSLVCQGGVRCHCSHRSSIASPRRPPVWHERFFLTAIRLCSAMTSCACASAMPIL